MSVVLTDPPTAASPGLVPYIPGRRLLGELIIVSIRESTAVPFAELAEAWNTNVAGVLAGHGLPAVAVPKQGNRKDAFRKATPKAPKEGGRFYFMAYDGKASYPDMVDAAVLVEAIDEVGRVDKQVRPLGVLWLHEDKTIRYQSDYRTTPAVERFLAEMQAAFDKNLDYANARQVRGMVNRALELGSKVTYHDGVHLIPTPKLDLLEGLKAFVEFTGAHTGGEPQKLVRIPYLDTDETRADLRGLLGQEIRHNVERILEEAEAFVTTRKDPHRVTAQGNKGLTLVNELMLMGARIADYEQVLSEAQTRLKLYLQAQQVRCKEILELP